MKITKKMLRQLIREEVSVSQGQPFSFKLNERQAEALYSWCMSRGSVISQSDEMRILWDALSLYLGHEVDTGNWR